MNIPSRMCVSCRKRATKTDLIRISNCDGKAVVDNNKNQKSRAIYVCRDEKCIEILQKSKAIQRILNAQSDEDFYDKLKNLI